MYETIKEVVAERIEKVVSKRNSEPNPRKILGFPLVSVIKPDSQKGNVIFNGTLMSFSASMFELMKLFHFLKEEFNNYDFESNVDDNSVIYLSFSEKRD